MQSELATDVDVDVILAAVLRIFAARGRAIREARAKLDTEQMLSESILDVSDKQEPELGEREMDEKSLKA